MKRILVPCIVSGIQEDADPEEEGQSLQQLTGSDAVWVRVDEYGGAQACEDQVIAAVENLLGPRMDVIKNLQVRLFYC